MNGLPREVADTRRAVRDSVTDLGPGDLVLVACSGGADSLALAAAAAVALPRLGLRVGGLTVDHQLQAGSDRRAADVAAALTGLGLSPVEVVAVDVLGGAGPEDAARRARQQVFDAVGRRLDAAAILLGHTLDDQAETVLLRLARGSGARSLAGMPAVAGRIRRPFLRLSRVTVRAAADRAGLVPWEDPHNSDRSFLRPRLRHDVLPSLEAAIGPGVRSALARSADLLRADADALDCWADTVFADAVDDQGVDLDQLGSSPEAVRTRVLRRAAVAAGCPGGDLTAAHVRTLDGFVTAWKGQGPATLPGGVMARRSCGRLLFGRGPRAVTSQETGGR
jgi:tRNA(Ile)-lysidine synthase